MSRSREIVLVVNDDEPNRYVTTRVLTRAGFSVIEASTGGDALRIVRESAPAVVVLDVNLPDISGIEVCRRIKADQATAAVLVLQVSATNVALSDRVASLSAGADTFLVEPVHPEELEAVTHALLRLHRSEEALRASLAERDLLLKEVNHRVKNSLQLVLSMLSLQSQEFSAPPTRELFAKAIARVTAIASIHERLYQSEDPLTVDMQSYLSGLTAELSRAGIGEARPCKLTTEVDPLRLPTEHGISLALIVNELVMNALKHGRPAAEPAKISVRLQKHVNGEARLTVADNGPGRVGTDGREQSGLGTRLVNMLVRQLKGHIETEDSASGYQAIITFPVPTTLPWRPAS
jgi:two-component sensor histidine kinase/CheY-like chemotaxis protein